MQGGCALGEWGVPPGEASLGSREDQDPGWPSPTELNRTKGKPNQPGGLRGGDGRAAVSGQGGSWESCQGLLPSCLHGGNVLCRIFCAVAASVESEEHWGFLVGQSIPCELPLC